MPTKFEGDRSLDGDQIDITPFRSYCVVGIKKAIHSSPAKEIYDDYTVKSCFRTSLLYNISEMVRAFWIEGEVDLACHAPIRAQTRYLEKCGARSNRVCYVIDSHRE